jgi:hypothetical protein
VELNSPDPLPGLRSGDDSLNGGVCSHVPDAEGDISLTPVTRDASVFWLTIAVDEKRSPTLWEVLGKLESVLVVLGLKYQRNEAQSENNQLGRFQIMERSPWGKPTVT